MRVTIKEVAKKADVSPSTVSRALKDSYLISQETKDKINEIADELGYFPNEIARSLANQTSQTLGLVLPSSAQDSFLNPFFTSFIQGVTRCLEEQDYSLLLASARNDADELRRIMRMTHSGRVDGIFLVVVREEDKNINYLLGEDMPFIIIGDPKEREKVLWVDNNNQMAMFEVVENLVNLGHKKIAFFGGKQELTVTQRRLKGYIKALEEHGLEVNEELILEVNFQEGEGYIFTKELIAKHKDIDAIVTTDDLIAYGVIRAVKELKIKIPDEISITGFNNTVLARYLSPSLSSVEINSEKLGYNSTDLLLKKIRKIDFDKNYCVVETNFIKRESSK
ncbi:MAG: LacI family transcriptional regulator [Clostridiales bacterium]|nr:LacI family transcriptional regulator [Clostridiales bacterium]